MLWSRRSEIAGATPLRSILLLHLDDRPAVGAVADLLVLIVRLDLEAQLAAVDLQQLGSDRNRLALGRGAEVLDVDLEPDRRVPLGEVVLHGLDCPAARNMDPRSASNPDPSIA